MTGNGQRPPRVGISEHAGTAQQLGQGELALLSLLDTRRAEARLTKTHAWLAVDVVAGGGEVRVEQAVAAEVRIVVHEVVHDDGLAPDHALTVGVRLP